jgi:hypothetical protein
MISASLWQISGNNQWNAFAEATVEVLSESTNVAIKPEEVKMNLDYSGAADVYKYRWGWTWPVFGLSLQETGQIDQIILPETYLEYVSPPNQLPFVSFDGSGYYSFTEPFLEGWHSDR